MECESVACTDDGLVILTRVAQSGCLSSLVVTTTDPGSAQLGMAQQVISIIFRLDDTA